MHIAEIAILGAALSADAFAVTVSNACTYTHERRRRLYLMPLFYGLFQALMPILGYLLGGIAADLIETYAGFVTLAILGTIGTNMIVEGIREIRSDEEEGEGEAQEGHLTIGSVLFQAIATAIDAFAVGVSFRAVAVSILPASVMIGAITCAFCIVALNVGRRLGRMLGDRAEVVGGIVLVLIGLKACFL